MKAIIEIAILFTVLAIALPAEGQGLADVTAATGVSNTLAGTSMGSVPHSALQAARNVANAASAAGRAGAGWETAGESKGGGGGQGWSSAGQASGGKGGGGSKGWLTAHSGGSRGGWATPGTPHHH